MIWPSLHNENKLTWKCKFFGCKDEELPLTFHDEEEKHGMKLGHFTATKMIITYVYRGCMWCRNFRAIREKEEMIFPMWKCWCETCEKSNELD
jgi:hypothetical protein